MIRAVFFDLDGTLYGRDAAILRMAERQFDALREHFEGISKERFLDRVVELDGHGHQRTPRLHQALAESFGLDAEVADRLETLFRSEYPRSCRMLPEERSVLVALRASGMKLAIITNGPVYWQSRKIEFLEVEPLFDAILISGAEGIEKPDPRIFARALDRCGVLPGETLFVGDHPDADIGGAVGAGMVPVWKRVPYWEVPAHVRTIDSLTEIPPLCFDIPRLG